MRLTTTRGTPKFPLGRSDARTLVRGFAHNGACLPCCGQRGSFFGQTCLLNAVPAITEGHAAGRRCQSPKAIVGPIFAAGNVAVPKSAEDNDTAIDRERGGLHATRQSPRRCQYAKRVTAWSDNAWGAERGAPEVEVFEEVGLHGRFALASVKNNLLPFANVDGGRVPCIYNPRHDRTKLAFISENGSGPHGDDIRPLSAYRGFVRLPQRGVGDLHREYSSVALNNGDQRQHYGDNDEAPSRANELRGWPWLPFGAAIALVAAACCGIAGEALLIGLIPIADGRLRLWGAALAFAAFITAVYVGLTLLDGASYGALPIEAGCRC